MNWMLRQMPRQWWDSHGHICDAVEVSVVYWFLESRSGKLQEDRDRWKLMSLETKDGQGTCGQCWAVAQDPMMCIPWDPGRTLKLSQEQPRYLDFLEDPFRIVLSQDLATAYNHSSSHWFLGIWAFVSPGWAPRTHLELATCRSSNYCRTLPGCRMLKGTAARVGRFHRITRGSLAAKFGIKSSKRNLGLSKNGGIPWYTGVSQNRNF